VRGVKSNSVRQARARARTVNPNEGCELEGIGGCKGILDRHHVDANPLNNAPSNVIVLCRSHHLLVEHGRIDLKKPIMPTFRVGRDGKRRYIYGEDIRA
jgi:hypothetical protein